ncbi:hypothetical protein ACTXT7_005060 [Hymenolepis weldensis]
MWPSPSRAISVKMTIRPDLADVHIDVLWFDFSIGSLSVPEYVLSLAQQGYNSTSNTFGAYYGDKYTSRQSMKTLEHRKDMMKYVKFEISRAGAAEEQDEILWTFVREEDVIYVYPNSSSLSGVIVLAGERTAEKYKSMSENVKKGWRIDIFHAKSILVASFAPQRQSTPEKGVRNIPIQRSPSSRPYGSSLSDNYPY